jgi:hypothetical protein
MTILTLAYPVQAAASLAETFSGAFGVALRSILAAGALGLVAFLAVVFKPLIVGSARALQLVVRPRMSAQQRQLLRRMEGTQMLTQLAKEADSTQPGLAAEMRYLAARG